MPKSIETRLERLETITDPQGIKVTSVWIMLHPDRKPTPDEAARLEKEAQLRYPDCERPIIEWKGGSSGTRP
ncbi:MAG: hypothetical protein HY673_13910 [Chloroflexi bacterium]|nr:hypothetical protein [Chloroflexota bacterium]